MQRIHVLSVLWGLFPETLTSCVDETTDKIVAMLVVAVPTRLYEPDKPPILNTSLYHPAGRSKNSDKCDSIKKF